MFNEMLQGLTLSSLRHRPFSALVTTPRKDADSSDDEDHSHSTVIQGDNAFELSESDTLNGDKNREISHELPKGEYLLEVQSLSSAKFRVHASVTSGDLTLLSSGRILKGRGKHSTLTIQFNVPSKQSAVVFRAVLRDKSKFWQKSSYRLSLTLLKTEKQQTARVVRVKVQVNGGIECRSVPSDVDINLLRMDLVRSYGRHVIKYLDAEDDMVTITNQDDLDHFFDYFLSNDKVPKLHLEQVSSIDSTGLERSHSMFNLKKYLPAANQTPRRRMNSTPQNTDTFPSLSLKENPSLSSQDSLTDPQSPSTPGSPMSTTSIFSTQHAPSPTGSDSMKSKNKIKTFQLGGMLGVGAVGKVFLGMNEADGNLIAVKEIPIGGLNPESEVIKNLEDEIELMSMLEHEHIVNYLGVKREKDYMYIFLDYIPGGSLSTILADFVLSESVIRKYSIQILEGLKYLHDNGIIHRDIKPHNLLLDEEGKVYLADFGCSSRLNEVINRTTKFSGTPNYMAPEIIEKQQNTRSADIWSFGCTVWEMFTRKAPYHHSMSHSKNVYQFFHFLLETQEELKIPSTVSEKAKDFLRKCLERDPDMRPTAETLLQHAFLTEPIVHSQEEEELENTISETSDSDEYDQFTFGDVGTYYSSGNSIESSSSEEKDDDSDSDIAVDDSDHLFAAPSVHEYDSHRVMATPSMKKKTLKKKKKKTEEEEQEKKEEEVEVEGSAVIPSVAVPSFPSTPTFSITEPFDNPFSHNAIEGRTSMDRRSQTMGYLHKYKKSSHKKKRLLRRKSKSFVRRKSASGEKEINNFLKKHADDMTVWAHPMKKIHALSRIGKQM